MGRRGLPKSHKDVDARPYLPDIEATSTPVDPQSFFPTKQPLEIEIGCGKGLFLRHASSALPDRNFLGIEVVGKYAQFVARRLAVDGRGNARILHTDGVQFLGRIPDASVAAVHIYFPDPWWKKRHRKRRVMNETLIASLEDVLLPEGRLHFWTDVKEYYESTVSLIAQHDRFVGPVSVEEALALHDMDYRTHFERRVRQNGLPVYRAEYYHRPWGIEFSVAPPSADASYVVGTDIDFCETSGGKDHE